MSNPMMQRSKGTPHAKASNKGNLDFLLNKEEPSEDVHASAARKSNSGRIPHTGDNARGPRQVVPIVPAPGTFRGTTSPKASSLKQRTRNFVCQTCQFAFYTKSDLQKHISSVHLQLRPYDCSKCDKKFGEKSNATKHFKSVHERQKNAACTQCNAVFAFKDGLTRHIRLVHDGVRKYRCTFPGCNSSAFKQSAHLKKHMQSVHKIQKAPMIAEQERTRKT